MDTVFDLKNLPTETVSDGLILNRDGSKESLVLKRDMVEFNTEKFFKIYSHLELRAGVRLNITFRADAFQRLSILRYNSSERKYLIDWDDEHNTVYTCSLAEALTRFIAEHPVLHLDLHAAASIFYAPYLPQMSAQVLRAFINRGAIT